MSDPGQTDQAELTVEVDEQIDVAVGSVLAAGVLGLPVDVVPDDGLKPDVRAAIEREAVAL